VADIADGGHPPAPHKHGRLRHIALAALILAAAYGLLAYIVLPALSRPIMSTRRDSPTFQW
jgi:hypothetical protein